VNDSMMQVTVHEETVAPLVSSSIAQVSASPHASDAETAEDDEMGVSMHYDELPLPKQSPSLDELDEEDADVEEDLIEITMHNDGGQVQVPTNVPNDAVESPEETKQEECRDENDTNSPKANRPEDLGDKSGTSPNDADSDEGSLI
jgi:hypothetical protein